MPSAIRSLAIALTIALTSFVASSQPAPDSRRIGILYRDSVTDRHLVGILVGELGRFGRVEGQNLVIDYRWTGYENVTEAEMAADLVSLGVDAIVTRSHSLVDAILQHSGAVPVVFCQHSDPLESGHAASLARPGGTVTGISAMSRDLIIKRFQLLMELMPDAVRLGFVSRGGLPAEAGKRDVEIAGAGLGFELYEADVTETTVSTYAALFSEMSREGVAGFWLGAHGYRDPDLGTKVAEIARDHGLASISSFRSWPELGGLMSYGPDRVSMHERCAWYVDQILRGADPAEIPIERPPRFEFVVNKRTMDALGFELPPTIEFAITELIE